jgi:lytic murein transglycosylase
MPLPLSKLGLCAIAVALLAGQGAHAQNCQPTQGFESWLEAFKREASAAGISRGAIEDGLRGVSFDPGIVRKDRAQGVFAQDFLTFSGRMVSGHRLKHGAANLDKYRSVFSRIEKEFGIPGPVIVGFWGLETDFGANSGKSPIMGALATLAYDCRRPEMFREQLLAALKIIDRGDLSREQMVGAWAGELGQTQFLPAHYIDYGVDYDGDGHVNLLTSVPDVLASTAKLLQHHGWKAGEPWLQEVSLSRDLPWKEADLAIRHPRSQWASWGVKQRDGRALPQDGVQASLLLPVGRFGPAFLAYENFRVYTEWNQSLVYATTAAYYATRLAGAPAYDKGKPGIPTFGLQETRELQQLLVRQGYEVGKIDGIIGAATRDAIRQVQIKYGLPADSYPSEELIQRLRGG